MVINEMAVFIDFSFSKCIIKYGYSAEYIGYILNLTNWLLVCNNENAKMVDAKVIDAN